jgi:hypothetical protein
MGLVLMLLGMVFSRDMFLPNCRRNTYLHFATGDGFACKVPAKTRIPSSFAPTSTSAANGKMERNIIQAKGIAETTIERNRK